MVQEHCVARILSMLEGVLSSVEGVDYVVALSRASAACRAQRSSRTQRSVVQLPSLLQL
jgi:hypothetical protein